MKKSETCSINTRNITHNQYMKLYDHAFESTPTAMYIRIYI